MLSRWVLVAGEVHHVLVVLFYLGLSGLGLWGEVLDESEDEKGVLLLETVYEFVLWGCVLSVHLKVVPLLIAFSSKTILKCELLVLSGLIRLIGRGFGTYVISLRLPIPLSPQPLPITRFAHITHIKIILLFHPFLLFFPIQFLLSLLLLLILFRFVFKELYLLFQV